MILLVMGVGGGGVREVGMVVCVCGGGGGGPVSWFCVWVFG